LLDLTLFNMVANLAFLYSNDLEVEATYEIFTDDYNNGKWYKLCHS